MSRAGFADMVLTQKIDKHSFLATWMICKVCKLTVTVFTKTTLDQLTSEYGRHITDHH